MPPKKSKTPSPAKVKVLKRTSVTSAPTVAKDHGPALPLPQFLKLLTSGPGPHPMTMSQAMKAASKLIPAGYNNLSRLTLLNQTEMAKLGIEDEEIRKAIAALTEPKGGKKRRWHRDSDLDKPLPDHAPGERDDVDAPHQDYDFDEILAEEALEKKAVITNRAPVMTAWAMVVAERLGFMREEALSIASVYTDLNAKSKGVSLGIMDKTKLEPGAGPAQPTVELMGRSVPVLRTSTGAYRAIAAGAIMAPSTAFGYITRSFRQQTGALIGALRLLAEAFQDPAELNEKGYALYCDFRPVVDKWGEKSEMRLEEVLALRSAARKRATKEELADIRHAQEGDHVRDEADLPIIHTEQALAVETIVKREDDLEDQKPPLPLPPQVNEEDVYDQLLAEEDEAALAELDI